MKPYYEIGTIPREITQYVVAGESIVFATRRHWAQVIEPVATALGSLLVIFLIGYEVQKFGLPGSAVNILFIGWVILLLRAIVSTMLWWSDWFVATTSRLLLSHGIIYKKVAMMPLGKVTDMSYNRTIPGRILGYGQFVMESAGQDQALHTVSFVPNSSERYREICSEIFHKKVANQVHPPIAMLGRTQRVSDERSFEPWEETGVTLEADERPATPFPTRDPATTHDTLTLPIRQRPEKPTPEYFSDADYDD